MSEMTERAARAMADEQGMGWERMFEPTRAMWRNLAKVAIEAMREPTEAMTDFADFPSDEAKATWQAMIDRALR